MNWIPGLPTHRKTNQDHDQGRRRHRLTLGVNVNSKNANGDPEKKDTLAKLGFTYPKKSSSPRKYVVLPSKELETTRFYLGS